MWLEPLIQGGGRVAGHDVGVHLDRLALAVEVDTAGVVHLVLDPVVDVEVARLVAEGIDAAAVDQSLHVVVDVVQPDGGVAPLGLDVTPVPADRDAGVGQEGELVVLDQTVAQKAEPHADATAVLNGDVVHVVVAYLDTFRPQARVVRQQPAVLADHETIARDVLEGVVQDLDPLAAAREAEAGAAEALEGVVAHDDVVGAPDLDRRPLPPPKGLVQGAVVGRGVEVGLCLRKPLAGAWLHPGGVSEDEAGDFDVVDWPVEVAPLGADELLEHRDGADRAGHVLTRARQVVEPAGRAVEVPLAGAIEQRVGVLNPIGHAHVEDALVGRARRRHVSLGALEARLLHGDVAVGGDAGDATAHLLPPFLVDELDVGDISPPRHVAVDADEAAVDLGGGEPGRPLAARACRAHPVDVQLSRGDVTDVRLPLAAGVRLPVEDPLAAEDARLLARVVAPAHEVAVAARVAVVELERAVEDQRAFAHQDLDVSGHVAVDGTHRVARSGQGPPRRLHGATAGVVAVAWVDHERDRRGGRRNEQEEEVDLESSGHETRFCTPHATRNALIFLRFAWPGPDGPVRLGLFCPFVDSSASPGPSLSQMVRFGRYVLEQRLAVGGMAEIFLARSEGPAGFAKRVVVKRILPGFEDNPDFVRMFLDEARIASRFNHPNLLHVYDLVEEGGQYAIVMELIEGEDLAAIIATCRNLELRVPFDVAVDIIAAAADGLHHAHGLTDDDGEPLGLVHRDVSPSNIIVTAIGGIKVVDFGIAKSSASRTRTQAGVVKGKIAYMSPEQVQSAAIDRRTDLFSLGSTLYELLTLERCFARNDMQGTIEALLAGDCVPLSTRRWDAPPALSATLDRLLAPTPDGRFATAADAATALRSNVDAPADTADKRIRGFLAQLEETTERREYTWFTAIGDTRVSADNPMSRPEVPIPREVIDEASRTELGTVPMTPAELETVEEDQTPDMVEQTLRVTAEAIEPTVLARQPRRHARPPYGWVVVIVAGLAGVTLAALLRSNREPTPAAATGSAPPASFASDEPASSSGETASSDTSSDGPAAASQPAIESAPSNGRPSKRTKRPALASAQLTLDCDPRAHVYVDGRKVGTTPLDDLAVKPGKRVVVLRPVRGGGDKTVPLDLRPGQHVRRSVTLATGSVVVHVTPWGRITFDGKSLGQTPLAPFSALEGRHEVVVINPELKRKRTLPVVVRPGETSRVVVEF